MDGRVMAGNDGSRDGEYPNQSYVDWGKSGAVRAPSRKLRRSYDFDGLSDMELPGDDNMRADGGLLSAEELPPGRVVTWE